MKHIITYGHIVNAYIVDGCNHFEKITLDDEDIKDSHCFGTRRCPCCGTI